MNNRYYSLDVFRGATVALMILVNNPGSWSHIYSPLKHAAWHGITPTDLVFPFFLFAVGNAMAFVMPRFREKGDSYFWKKVIRRTLLIFAIGLFLNWWPFSRWVGSDLVANGWTWVNSEGKVVGVRILGVLQRIALCYFFASIITYYTSVRVTFLIGALLLLIYWGLCIAGNPSDPYSMTGFFGTPIDLKVLTEPHMYHVRGVAFDPEGLMSTIPSIVNVIFGYLVGDYIIKQTAVAKAAATAENNTNSTFLYRILTVLFMASMALMIAGYAWGLSFPINKQIWTSSYVVLTSGMAIAILAILIFAIEVKGVRGGWTRFFDVFGKNALFVFALSAFLPKGLRLIRIPNGVNAEGLPKYLSPWNWIYEKVYKTIPLAPEFGSLLFALTVILFMWAICYWLDRRKIYIKV